MNIYFSIFGHWIRWDDICFCLLMPSILMSWTCSIILAARTMKLNLKRHSDMSFVHPPFGDGEGLTKLNMDMEKVVQKNNAEAISKMTEIY